jgi:hypothetical protein
MKLNMKTKKNNYSGKSKKLTKKKLDSDLDYPYFKYFYPKSYILEKLEKLKK